MAIYFDGEKKINILFDVKEINGGGESESFKLYAHYLRIAAKVIDSETGEEVEDTGAPTWFRIVSTRETPYTFDYYKKTFNELFNPENVNPIEGSVKGAFPRNVISVNWFRHVGEPYSENWLPYRNLIDVNITPSGCDYAYIDTGGGYDSYLYVTKLSLSNNAYIWFDQVREYNLEIDVVQI